MSRWRAVNKLADELKKSKATMAAELVAKQIPVLDGYYDHGLYEAQTFQPKGTGFALSPRLGLGMAKAVLDKIEARIIVHDPKGTQYLFVRRGAKQAYLRWYYSNTGRRAHCKFVIRGFLSESMPDHYLFTCFETGKAWALSRKELCAMHGRLRAGKPDEGTYEFTGDPGPHGAITLFFLMEGSKYELTSAKQLGL